MQGRATGRPAGHMGRLCQAQPYGFGLSLQSIHRIDCGHSMSYLHQSSRHNEANVHITVPMTEQGYNIIGANTVDKFLK